MFLNYLNEGFVRCKLRGSKVLLAVSGGADSVALLVGCTLVRDELDLELHVAHLDHCLRDESATDAKWVVELCAKLNIPISAEARTVRSNGEPATRGIEESARRVRYEFLNEVADSTQCAAIVTAHHADDQVETVLHHFRARNRRVRSTRNGKRPDSAKR